MVVKWCKNWPKFAVKSIYWYNSAAWLVKSVRRKWMWTKFWTNPDLTSMLFVWNCLYAERSFNENVYLLYSKVTAHSIGQIDFRLIGDFALKNPLLLCIFSFATNSSAEVYFSKRSSVHCSTFGLCKMLINI